MKKMMMMAFVSAATILGATAAHAMGCSEGQREIFLENTDSSAEHMSPVTYVCRNGKFVGAYGETYQERQTRLAKKSAVRGCVEGQEETFLENTDSSAEHMEPVRYVCRNGKFTGKYGPSYMEKQAWASKRAGHRGCVEGQREIFLEQVGSSNENAQPVTYVCRGGRFIDIYRVHKRAHDGRGN